MTEPTLEGLQRELRALRRTLYVTLSIAGALGVAMIASCASKAPPPTKLTFGDAGHRVDIDADGLFISAGARSVRITAGTVNATDALVVIDEATGTTSMTPASLRLGNKDGSAVLQVKPKIGASLEIESGDKSVEMFAKRSFAGVTVRAPEHVVTSSASERYALVSAQHEGGPQASFDVTAGGGCVKVERLGDDAAKPSKLCVGPVK
jgi:hypothetical protein